MTAVAICSGAHGCGTMLHYEGCPVYDEWDSIHKANALARARLNAERTGVHHVGWDSHAQRGTKPYEESDTTGSTW